MAQRDPPEIRTDVITRERDPRDADDRRADPDVPAPDEPSMETVRRLELPPGEAIDHFKIIRRLGHGGMGEVYLARDTRLGRKVAIKVLSPAALGSRDAGERFLFEARATARFAHPHIVTVYHVGEHEGRPYLAMEYLEGQTLRDRLWEARLGTREALRFGLAVAEALREAHRNQILHRDLKPGNVMIPRDGRLRVVDFGLAKLVDVERISGEVPSGEEGSAEELLQASAFHTVGKGARGTPFYMAPEQWSDAEVTGAADVWALGLLLFEMLAGRHPYAGTSVFQLAYVVSGVDPMPPLPETAAPPPVAELVARCLDKDPEQRPGIEEVLPALQELVAGAPRRAPGEDSPFRGLLPFDEAHADLFFGRDAEIAAALERMRTEPVLPVVGPSGVGKSSFVAAGLIPRLREQCPWIVLKLRPGARPFRALAARLLSGGETRWSGSGTGFASVTASRSVGGSMASVSHEALDGAERELTEELLAKPGALALRLLELAEGESAPGEPARVLLCVDQLEELFTLVEREEERQAFLEAVCRAADDPDGPVRVVFTVREDFLGRLAPVPAARAALAGVTVLGTPGADALVDALVRPVEGAGFTFDDDELPRRMVDEVRDEPAALPLLQFAGRTLWDGRDRRKRRLLRATYEEMGGVAGCLARHADGLLRGLAPEQVRQARALLLRLVTPEGTRRVMPRGRLLEGLGEDAAEVLDQLVRERLVVARRAREADPHEAQMELVHESLVQSWRQLARWIEEGREELAFLAQVEQAAELWEARGARDEEVWQGAALEEAREQLARMELEAPTAVQRFLDAGVARQRSRRARQRWLGMGLALGVIVLFVGGIALIQHLTSPARLCSGADERLLEVWDDDHRRAISSSFADSGSAHAGETARRVQELLDLYAVEWASMYTDACEATHVRGEQSEHRLDLRMACLDRRRTELDALVGVLTNGVDERTVDRASDAAYALTPILACAEADALEARHSMPEDPATRESVEQLQFRLDEIVAKQRTGKLDQAAELIDPLVEDVRAVEYPPLLAEALYRQGVIGMKYSELDPAEEALKECAEIAAEITDDRLVADAMIAITILYGYNRRLWDEGLAYYEATELLVARAGNQPKHLSLMHNHMGILLSDRGELEQALQHYERALELAKEGFGEEHPKVADYLNNIGVWYARQGRFAEAMPYFEQSAALTEETLGSEHPDFSNNLNNIGLVYKNLEDMEGATEYLERALALRQKTLGEEHPLTASSHSNLGELLYDQGRCEEAVGHFEQAIASEIAAHGEAYPPLAYALTGLGDCELALGRPEDARDHARQALQLREEADIDPAIAAECHFVLARAAWDLGNHAAARRHADTARRAWIGRDGWDDELATLEAWEAGR